MKQFLTKLKNKKMYVPLLILSAVSAIYLFSVKTPPQNPDSAPTPLSPPELLLLNVSPPEGDQITIWDNFAVEYMFNQPVDAKTIKYTVSPFIETKVFSSPDNKVIYISPSSDWKKRVIYQIRITDLKTLADPNLSLSQPSVHEFQVIESPKDLNIMSQ